MKNYKIYRILNFLIVLSISLLSINLSYAENNRLSAWIFVGGHTYYNYGTDFAKDTIHFYPSYRISGNYDLLMMPSSDKELMSVLSLEAGLNSGFRVRSRSLLDLGTYDTPMEHFPLSYDVTRNLDMSLNYYYMIAKNLKVGIGAGINLSFLMDDNSYENQSAKSYLNPTFSFTIGHKVNSLEIALKIYHVQNVYQAFQVNDAAPFENNGFLSHSYMLIGIKIS